MYDPIESFTVDGHTVELHPDWEDPPSPKDWDNLGTLVAFSPLWKEYGLGHRESTGEEDEAVERGGLRLLARYLSMTAGALIVPFTFQDYGSSGQRIYETDLDDDRAAGFILTTPERVAELCGDPAPGQRFWKPADHAGTASEWVEGQLRNDLGQWRAYVEGAIVGVVVKDERGEVVESVWGFYPDPTGPGDDGYEYVREEGRSTARVAIEDRTEQRRKTAQAWQAAHRREEQVA